MTKAERIRSYMADSGMSRAEATALVDFEGADDLVADGKPYPHFDTEREQNE